MRYTNADFLFRKWTLRILFAVNLGHLISVFFGVVSSPDAFQILREKLHWVNHNKMDSPFTAQTPSLAQ